MMENKLNIPALRFPEFVGEWEEKRLGDVVTIIDGDRGKNYPKSIDFFDREYCIFLSAKNVTKYGFIFNDIQFITKERDDLLRKGKLKRGDVVLTTRGTVGQFALYEDSIRYDNMRINSGMVLLRIKSENLSNKFLYKICNSYEISKQIKVIAFGSAQPQLTVAEITKIKLTLPPLPEQQKIASFLTAVDAKIAQLSQKGVLLGEYKRGAMQGIFSQEIRFLADDGSLFGDWVERRLGEVAFITTGNGNREDSGTNGQYIFFDRSDDIRTSEKYLFDDEVIIVAGEGSSFPPKYFKGKFDLHQRTYAIMKFDNVYAKYIYYFMDKNKNHFLRYAVGSTVKSLRLPMFKTMPINLPSLPEQTKIANFLSAIDTKIAQNTQILEKMKTFKRGLLQKMFA